MQFPVVAYKAAQVHAQIHYRAFLLVTHVDCAQKHMVYQHINVCMLERQGRVTSLGLGIAHATCSAALGVLLELATQVLRACHWHGIPIVVQHI